MSSDHKPLRLAATLVVVRDAPAGLEVLLSRRSERGDHFSGAWVFPGGVVDPGDHLAQRCVGGLDDAEASITLGLPDGGCAHYIAAIRECFEESGLLFARDGAGELIRLDDIEHTALSTWRGLLHRGERTLAAFCDEFGLTLALDRLIYLSHWVTPQARPKRFDTRFFLAEAPPAQTAAFDGQEMVEQRWLRPADALNQAVDLKLMTPTRKTLAMLKRFDAVAPLMAWARSSREIPRFESRLGIAGDGEQRVVAPDEPAWAEIGRLDPEGRGTARCDIRIDRPARLSPRVIRVTAGNGSLMTGPGTNTYLVGGSADGWAVIDPGPLDDAHVAAIIEAAPGPIRWIFATHTHHDHSPATIALQARTGATVHGRLPAFPEWQDTSFAPDVHLAGGERIVLPGPDGATTTLRAIHTPGHASNHLCYLLEEEKLLFTGDHVMQQSTVVINPPDGDMAAYLASLSTIAALDLEWLAPGHGFLMAEPQGAIAAIVAHRLKREAKVLAASQRLGRVDAPTLLAAVYDDVDPRLLAAAMRSLRAHLFKLRDEGRVREEGDHWAPGAR